MNIFTLKFHLHKVGKVFYVSIDPTHNTTDSADASASDPQAKSETVKYQLARHLSSM